MTVINTNVGALTARTYSIKANDAMQKSMERLSSGLRINSAADDAAGLAVANKMESQLRGMNVAIRNSQDGISLVQTAEAGMGEISNMVIRMRELAVQMNNGVYTDADRANAQLEVDSLLKEINKIANNTAFNDVKVLNGSYSKDIRAGNTNVETIAVTIDRMNTDTLGGTYVTTGSENVSGDTRDSKVANFSTTAASVINVGKGDEITFAVSSLSGEFASSDANSFVSKYTGGTWEITGTDKDLFNLSNDKATITSDAGLVRSNPNKTSYSINLVYKKGDISFTDAVTIKVGAAPEASAANTSTTAMTAKEGAVTIGKAAYSSGFQAFIDADKDANGAYKGTFVLDGTDKADFTLADNKVPSLTATLDFETAADTATSYTLKYTASDTKTWTETVNLTLTDDTNEAAAAKEKWTTSGTINLGQTIGGSTTYTATVTFADNSTVAITTTGDMSGNDGNRATALTDLATKLSTAADTAAAGNTDAGIAFTVVGGQLVAEWDTAGALANEVASIALTMTAGNGDNTGFDGGTFAETTDSADAVTAAGGAAAYASGGSILTGTKESTVVKSGTSNLKVNEAREGVIKVSDLSAALAEFAKNKDGVYSLAGTDKDLFNIDTATGEVKSKGLVDYETKSSYSFEVKYTKGESVYTETIALSVVDSTVDNGTHLADVNLSTTANASSAVTILDTALNQISSSQAKLGAIQNRLQHNIDNLSMASMLTETARGRVVDADFARETSELSKQQILGQAATSMLAQANQSKQSVLALLQ